MIGGFIGRGLVRGVVRGAVSGGGQQQPGPPKEWSPGGKAVAVVVIAFVITAMHWWLVLACWAAGSALVSLVMIPWAMDQQAAKRRAARPNAGAVDQFMASRANRER